MKKKYSIIIYISLLTAFFLWGFIFATYKTFPYSFVRDVYWKFNKQNVPRDKNKEVINYINNFYDNKKLINFQIKEINKKFNNIEKNSNLFRNKIINQYILPKELIKFDELDVKEIIYKKTNITFSHHQFKSLPKEDSILLKVKYYGINHYGILETNKKNNKLLIYHQGHAGNPYNFKYFLELKEMFNKKGYDILSLSMSGLGYNLLSNKKYSFPINPNKDSNISFNFEFNDKEIMRHDIYQLYHDENFPNTKPLALMLSGNYYIIQKLKNNYDKILMIGISGGGWATTILSALIPEIQNSYSFHSFFPKFFNINKYTRTQWEFVYSDIWKEYDYWDFYFLALFDNKNLYEREHHLIYNLKHKGFENYNDPYATKFKELVNLLKINKLKVTVFDKNKHEIDINFVEEYILNKLE